MTRAIKENDLVMFVSRTGKCWITRIMMGKEFSTHLGKIRLEDVLGKEYGDTIKTTKGHELYIFRPALHEYVLKLRRGAQIIYPKDAATILTFGDVRNGKTVLEAGTGSGGLTCFLVDAVGVGGRVVSVERRRDFMRIARENIMKFFGKLPKELDLVVGDIKDMKFSTTFDRAILDILDPWNAIENVAEALIPGGILVCYLTNINQVQKTVEAMKDSGKYLLVRCFEVLMRDWVVDERRARPKERMVAHTGFILVARKIL